MASQKVFLYNFFTMLTNLFLRKTKFHVSTLKNLLKDELIPQQKESIKKLM